MTQIPQEWEYKALRDEILKRIEWRYQIIGLNLTLLAAMFAFAKVENGSPVLLTFYPPIATLLAVLCTGNEINIGYLVEYIHDEMEPRISGLGWEKWVKKKRDHGFLARFRKPLIWNFIYFLACQAFAIGVALLMICPNLSYSQYLFGIDIISLFLTIVTLVIARFKRHGEGIS